MWPESSYVKSGELNSVEKSATIAETIFPKGLLIIGAPCRWGGPGSYESL